MMKVVDKDFNDLLPDEGCIIKHSDGHLELIFLCPQCGKLTASATGGHKYNPETNSITPSVVHDPKLGGCGFHKTLTNGVWH